MTTQIAVRLDNTELSALDAEVAAGRAASRSDAVRRAIARLNRHQPYEADNAILDRLALACEEPYPDLVGLCHLPVDHID
ncbi:MAG: ribbon-helix-helix domain-containing protein [Bifidobacteriaceae bacterium]|jgi:Arc/MetJ-type ribon-helix-helix transcriptional regulator|nr:ribbon-helix-helix domain-containing protein [Bifidobacteriaceae bacterium]